MYLGKLQPTTVRRALAMRDYRYQINPVTGKKRTYKETAKQFNCHYETAVEYIRFVELNPEYVQKILKGVKS